MKRASAPGAAGFCCGLLLAACLASSCTDPPGPLPPPSTAPSTAPSPAPVTGTTSAPPFARTTPPVPTSPIPSASADATNSMVFLELQASLEVFSRELISQGAPAVLMEARSGLQSWTSAAGVRSLESGLPVDASDPIVVGGVLRSMLAVSVLKLVEEGKAALDVPVSAYLPDLTGGVAGGSDGPVGDLSLRYLLADSSGRDSSRWADTVLIRVVERLRGAALIDVLRREVWGPLGLRSMALLDDAGAIPNLVHGYASTDGGTVDITETPPTAGQSPPRLVSSAADVNTFQAALLGGRLLAPSSLLLMKGMVSADYGLGLDQWDDRCTNGNYYGHAGDLPGFGTITMSSADGNRQLTIAVATPPEPVTGQPSAIVLELTHLAQVVLNSSCRFRFG
ncbi:serine hydrolase domain-containing protein [Paenarthrobacter sp. NPDC090520]|uniref:serine hydrolase domain-containing protein n=1 Tax=Paenarthrobacter sp. NPDC090520 TaxID=3364382 RepID=UPI0037FA4F8B